MIEEMTTRRDAGNIDLRSDYYQWLRTDVLAHVPAKASHVLSIGCGAGVTEAELILRGVAVTAVELNPVAAAMARKRGLNVLEGDVSTIEDALQGQCFDCLIYADVLEHTPDPESVLRRHVQQLRPAGTVIISVPNFRHYSVFWQLFISGQFRYVDSGIFDRTHLRITTSKGVRAWVERSGLVIRTIDYGIPRRRERLLANASFGLLSEFVARQVLLVAIKPS